MEKIQHLKIPLEDIKLATNNFSDENYINRGGFGKVYIGNLTHNGKQNIVAVKRLVRSTGLSGQGNHEFITEIQMLSSYMHTNLIFLIGFCEENEEKILVYEHAKHGSLDKYLSDDKLSWVQRLNISLGAARGFNYLHNGVGPQHRVLHRDIKSSNILLNENWEAKISDFGLSRIGPSNVEFTFLVTSACGTLGYIDPQYRKTGILTKESDVYSFGVVLFEILCGRLAMINTYKDERRFLASLAKQSYKQNRLNEIILPRIKNEINVDSFNIFSMVAYQCLNETRTERPTMGWVVEKLEESLKHQNMVQMGSIVKNMVKMSWTAEKPEEASNHQENIDALIEWIREDSRSSQHKFIAAFTIYKCLIHWKCFEAERTSVFDRLVQMMGSAIEGQYNSENIAYWLSVTSILLLFVKESINSDDGSASLSTAELEIILQFEAKGPALLFKQQLSAYMEKIYGIFCDNFKRELSPVLSIFIQAPRANKGVLQSNHEQDIIDCLNNFFNPLEKQLVISFVVQSIFIQIYKYVNVQLFNSLFLHPGGCNFSNGEYINALQAELRIWCSHKKEEYTRSTFHEVGNELDFVGQAVGFLVIPQKDTLSVKDIYNDLCTYLSAEQIYKICTLFTDDKYNNQGVSPDVISDIMKDLNNDGSNSFLLENDSIMPFSADDFCRRITLNVEAFADLKHPVQLTEHPAFHFLRE